jgi:hypothetical protein
MKICNSCGEQKPYTDFNKKNNGHQPYCRSCDNTASRKRYAENKETHKSVVNARNARVRKERAAWLKEIKESNPCTDCGKYYPGCVMDFDHTRDKSWNISSKRLGSIEALIAEMDKCEIVCSNCHRIRTAKRAGYL